MSESDLKLVSRALATDLSEIIVWNKLKSLLRASPIPLHHKKFDDEFWKGISAMTFSIEKSPIKVN